MARRKRQRRPREKPATVDYIDPEGNVLTLRQTLSAGTIAKVEEGLASAAASQDDAWRRRSELLFERLAVRWEIAGVATEGQKALLMRFRVATQDERRFVRDTLRAHAAEHFPELQAP